MKLPASAVQIGPDQYIVFSDYEGEVAGIGDWHKDKSGNWCVGWVSFNGSKWHASFNGKLDGWDVVKADPLTLSPSIKCRVCGNHGRIIEGQWRPEP